MTTLGKKWKIKDTTKMKGRKIEWGDKISKSLLGKHISEESKKKMSMAKKGKKLSEEHRQKISKGNMGKKMPPKTKETLLKMSLAHIGKTKEKCPNWRGGISFEPYSVDWTETLKRSIRERDKYTCKICNKEPSVHVHHIDYDKLNCNPNNLITLCINCHSKTNYNREKWLEYFKSIL